MEQPTAVLIGGPWDQTPMALDDATIVHEERANGTVHRYVRTPARREVDGRELTVYNYDGQTYDGAVNPQPE